MNSTRNRQRIGNFGLFNAKLLTAAIVSIGSLGVIPQIALAANPEIYRCSPNNFFVTQNVGLVTENPVTVCPTGDPLVSPRCTTLSFSEPGPFSIQHAFNFEPQCPNELYEVTFTGTYGEPMYLRPKYIVIGVIYAPPGSASTATYGTGFMSGTTTNLSQSFGQTTSVSVALSGGFNVGIFSVGGTVKAGDSWTQTESNSSSISVNQTYSNQVTWPGPLPSAGPGVDHMYDEIEVWLDPEVNATVTGQNTVQTLGYYLDPRDPLSQGADPTPDIVYLTVGQLEAVQAISPTVQASIDRTWDPDLGPLDSTDFAEILEADPFAVNSGFDPDTDTSGRYVPVSNSDGYSNSFVYEPTAPGGQPACDAYTATYLNSQSVTKGGSDSHTVSYSIDASASFDGGADKGEVTFGQSFTYTNSWSTTLQNQSSNTASFKICQPPSTYSGPTYMQIWEDSVYGTYMFYPVYD